MSDPRELETTTTETTPPTTTTTATTFGSEELDPAAGPGDDFGAPATAPLADAAAAAPAPAAAPADPTGTSELLATGADLAVGALFGPPPAELEAAPVGGLTPEERQALAAALAPVLAKYELGGPVPFAEELTLAGVSVSIVMRRLSARRRARAELERQPARAAGAALAAQPTIDRTPAPDEVPGYGGRTAGDLL